MSATTTHAPSGARTNHPPWLLEVGLLLAYVGTRLFRLDGMPPHIDEIFHITRARDVWSFDALYFVNTTKVLNVWLIALFYPFANGVWIARIVSVFSGLLAMVGTVKLGDLLFSRSAGLIAGLLYLVVPLAFWHDRIAVSDPVANATGVMLVLASVLYVRRPTWRYAAWVGASLALATLSKLTMLFFWPVPLLAWLVLGTRSLREILSRRTLGRVALAYGLGVLFIAPLATYVLLNYSIGGQVAYSAGDDFSLVTILARLPQNLAHLSEAARGLVGWQGLVWLLLALLVMAVARSREGLFLVGAALLPLSALMAVGSILYNHYYIVGLPPLLALMGASATIAWGWLRGRLPAGVSGRAWTFVGGLLLGAVAASWVPFLTTTYAGASETALPGQDYRAYVSGHTSGYGWEVAADWFERQAATTGRDIDVVGPVEGHAQRMAVALIDVPGIDVLFPEPLSRRWLDQHFREGADMYLVRDDMSYAPRPPFDWDALGVSAELVATHPKPGNLAWVEIYKLVPAPVGSEGG